MKLHLMTFAAISFLFIAGCGQNRGGKSEEKLKEELKAELRAELKEELRREAENESEINEEEGEIVATNEEKTDESFTMPKRSNPTKVDFDAEMLENLTLVGKNNVIRLKQDHVEKYSLSDGSLTGKETYFGSGSGSNLENAVTIVSDNELVVEMHQDFAIGGKIIIKKQPCEKYNSKFYYSFEITWENETQFNDTGCAFHSNEEYEITAKLNSAGFGTGGDYFIFTGNNNERYNFIDGRGGVDLKAYFPEIEPMSDKNPYENKTYKVFYKFAEIEDHRGFRVEEIITYIEEIQ